LSDRRIETRKLSDLGSVGPATLDDFRRLGITRVEQLVGQSAAALYERLCRGSGVRHDPCALDVFACAIAQAEDPALPRARTRWWYWSRRRKSSAPGKKP
jgi:hypothetical protein